MELNASRPGSVTGNRRSNKSGQMHSTRPLVSQTASGSTTPPQSGKSLFNDAHFRIQNTSFPLFPELPFELRAQIWKRSLCGSRLIPLHVNRETVDARMAHEASVLSMDEINGRIVLNEIGDDIRRTIQEIRTLDDDDDIDDDDDTAMKDFLNVLETANNYSNANNSGNGAEECRSLYTSQNSLGRTISGANYLLSVDDYRSSWSPLLGVCRESRKLALEAYRLRLPLRRRRNGRLVPRDHPDGAGMLYVSPEHDVLSLTIRHQEHTCPHLLAHILHDARAYDPENIGIMHLGLGVDRGHSFGWDTRGFGAFFRCISPVLGEPYELHPVAKKSLGEILANGLQSVVAIVTLKYGACVDSARRPENKAMPDFGRGYPLSPATASFDCLPRDPRPVEPELQEVAQHLHENPRVLEAWWGEIEYFALAKDGGEEPEDVSMEPEDQQMGPASGVGFCIALAVQWARAHPPGFPSQLPALSHPTVPGNVREFLANPRAAGRSARHGRTGAEVPAREMQPAVGMWLLRPDAFPELTEYDGLNDGKKRVVTMSDSRPGLIVFDTSR